MKSKSFLIRFLVATSILVIPVGAFASTDTWTGAGGSANPFWLSPINWSPSGIPQTGDNLVFTNTITLVNSNNIPGGSFNSITFATPSGAFDLKGIQTTLTGGITNNQVVTTETIEFPIVLSGNVNVDVTANGALTLTNTISGSGSLSKSSPGILTLNGQNTFAGPLTVNNGTVALSAETNLPAAPATPTPGNIVLNGGALQNLASFVVNTNHGIAVGPPAGAGPGIINVNDKARIPNQYNTLRFQGVIANNGPGIGGLTKDGFGNLILGGANTYTGTTSNRVGTLTLDFAATTPAAPQNSIISTSSQLVLGGLTPGAGATNFAALVVSNKVNTINSQTFNGTHVTIGESIIRTVPASGGTLNIALGTLDHDAGGILTLIPPSVLGGTGNITTTSANGNGILGGWATIGSGTIAVGWQRATNWACNDGSGNIVNYTGFTVYNSASTYMSSVMAAANNIYVTGITTVFTNAPDGAGTTNNVNSIYFNALASTADFDIGSNNVIRLGQYGGLFKYDTGGGNSNILGGVNYGNTIFTNSIYSNYSYNQASAGAITAGGTTPGTPGEIVLINDSTGSGSAQNWNIDAQIIDNAGGAVTVIKAGSGYTKFRNHNSYSGGTYLLGGRLQVTGGDIGSAAPDGLGTGPVYVFPGAYLFGDAPYTPVINIAGVGTVQELDGAWRLSSAVYTNTVVMFGDSGIGGGNATNPAILLGPISGNFNMYLGAQGNVGGNGSGIMLSNQCLWTGDTILVARLGTSGNSMRLFLDENDALPHGFGKGNLIFGVSGINAANRLAFDLNGFNQTINALLTGFTGVTNVIFNGSNSVISTLTIGDNDAGGTWGGIIEDIDSVYTPTGTGIMAVTKIGGGVEVFTNANTYSGATTISNGVLQLTGSGSIANSTNINIFDGTFDVSSIANDSFGSSQVINVTGGTLLISTATANGSVNFTNGTLKVTTMNPAPTPNLTASTINLGGAANLIQPALIPLIDVYPQTFVIASYTTMLNGNTNTLGVILPAGGFPAYAGYVTVDPVAKQILLVMTNGPITPSLTWAGVNFNTHTLDGNWNVTDPNWTNKPAHTSASYSDGSLVTFDDSGMTGQVNLMTIVTPAGVTVTNGGVNYTFTGTGAIYGTNGVTKEGVGKLTLDNTGGDSYNGLTIGGGIVQMGINDTGGSLGTNGVANNGTLVFNRVNSTLLISNAISGSGGILVSNATSTTTILSGNNGGYNGSVYVQTGQTLAPANAGALSSTNGTVTIPTGTTLDVSGSGIAANTLAVGKMVQVAGAGVDGTSGAIVNNVATNQQNALLRVTLAGDTTFGGTGARWDIRGTPAQHGVLSTGGNLYNVIKKGAYFMSIANVDVDTALSNVDVQVGTLEVNGATTGMGNSGTLTIENGATLQLYNMTNTTLNKSLIVLNGDGLTTTLTNALGNNVLAGQTMLSNSVIVAVNTGSLALSNYVFGTGTLTKSGTNTLVLTGPGKSYSGATTVSDGTLLINNSINSGSVLTENQTATASTIPVVVGGNGTNGAAMDIEDTLWPGVSGKPATFGAGSGSDYVGTTGGGALVFNDQGTGTPKAMFSLNTATTAGGGVNDLVTVNGNFNGNFASVLINPLTPLTVNSPYTLVTYTGNNTAGGLSSVGISVVGAFQPSRYTFSLDQTSNPHKTFLTVLTGAGNLVWNNAASTGIWDTNAANANWLNTGTSANDRFYQLDAVTFNDSIGAGVTTINIATTNVVPGTVTVSNTAVNYTFYGNGSIGGAANLVKQNSGTLTLSNANTFTGTVTVKGGTLAANADNALGSASVAKVYGGALQVNGANLSIGSVLITNGTVLVNNTNGLGGVTAPIYVTNSGTLDIGGASFSANQIPLMGSEPIYISGWGVNSNGCLINSSTNNTQEDAFQNIIMTGDAAIGGVGIINGPGRFDIGRLTNNPTLSTGGNPYNLYKVGSNQVSFVAVTVDTNLGNIDIKGGELGFEQGTTSMGNPLSNCIVEAGTTLEFYSTSGTNIFTKQFTVTGNGVTTNVFCNNGTVTINGTMALNNVVGIGVAGTALTNNAQMSGTGAGVIKTGGGQLILTTNETYTSNTTISGGTLMLLGNGSINNSPNINMSPGTTIDVSARVNNTLTLTSGQTLAASGNGTINGTLTNLLGTVSLAGTNGVLTVSANATLGNLVAIQLDSGSNVVMAVNGIVTYGGTLTVTTNAASTTPLIAGTVYHLFQATTYNGSFSTVNLPALGAGLTWNTSNLGINGTISIVSAVTPTPVITSISLSGTTLTFTATNGTASGSYALLSSTNVALPLSQWKPVFTNSFNGSGDINLSTNVVDPSQPQTFYILQVLP